MRFLYGTIILIFILFFHEIGSSFLLKKISTKEKSSNYAEDSRAVSIHDTSRLTMPSAARYDPTSIRHQALDLHGYQSHIPESSHQQGSAEATDLVNRFEKNKALPSKGRLSTRTIQNHQIQHQEHPDQGNIDWLIQHSHNGAPPVPQSADNTLGVYGSYHNPYDGNSNELTQMSSMRLRRNSKTNPNDGHSKKPSSSHGATSSRRVQNNQIQHHNDPHTLTGPNNNFMENRLLEYNQEQPGQGSAHMFDQHGGPTVYPPTQSQKNSLYLHKSHQTPNFPDLNNPINIPEGQEKRRSKTKRFDLNKNGSHVSPEMQEYYAFLRGPMIQGPHSPPGQGSVDLFNQHYKHKAYPSLQSQENAIELYKFHKNRNVPDLNKAIHISEERGRRKSDTKGINLNKNVCHISAEVKASHEFVKQPITQVGPHSPLRAFEDKQEITTEQLKKQCESLELYHMHYGYPDAPSYRELFEDFSIGSSSNSGN